MAGMIYQLFVLDKNKQEKVDRIKSQKKSIDGKREIKLIDFLKRKYTVLVSNSTYAGVYTIIIVGAELDMAKNIKTDFGRISQELELHFGSGAFFTEAS